eukprot:scaffold29235_cov124-Isochrysis_galbana.AAC.2
MLRQTCHACCRAALWASGAHTHPLSAPVAGSHKRGSDSHFEGAHLLGELLLILCDGALKLPDCLALAHPDFIRHLNTGDRRVLSHGWGTRQRWRRAQKSRQRFLGVKCQRPSTGPHSRWRRASVWGAAPEPSLLPALHSPLPLARSTPFTIPRFASSSRLPPVPLLVPRLIDQPKVVAHEHHTAGEALDGAGKAVDSVHIQVVGRLVQQHDGHVAQR